MTTPKTSKNLPSCAAKSCGFSLPELLIVLLVIAILAVIALPVVFKTLQLRKLDTSVSKVADKSLEVRMYAIKRNREAWLRIDPATRTFRVQSRDDLGATIDLDTAESFPDGVNTTIATPTEFHFDSLGRRAAGGQTVTFKVVSTGQTPVKTVSVSPAGKINVSGMTYEP